MLSRRRIKFTKSACEAGWEWLSKAPIAPYTKNQGARPARRPTHTGDREGVTTGGDHARPKGAARLQGGQHTRATARGREELTLKVANIAACKCSDCDPMQVQ